MNESIRKLVDRAADLERTMKGIKEKQDEIASKLQQEALAMMQTKKVKTIQLFGTNGNYVLVTKASKVSLLSYDRIKKVLKENMNTMISSTVSYSLKKEFKVIAEGIFKAELEHKTVEEVLKEVGLEDKQISVVTKKLKLDYLKDKEVLKSVGLKEEDVETYLFFVHEAIVYEKIKEALKAYEGEAYTKAVEEIKASVILEETPKITIKYEE